MSSVILVTGASSRFGAATARALTHCARFGTSCSLARGQAHPSHATPGGGHTDISRSYYVPASGTLLESWAPLRRAR